MGLFSFLFVYYFLLYTKNSLVFLVFIIQKIVERLQLIQAKIYIDDVNNVNDINQEYGLTHTVIIFGSPGDTLNNIDKIYDKFIENKNINIKIGNVYTVTTSLITTLFSTEGIKNTVDDLYEMCDDNNDGNYHIIFCNESADLYRSYIREAFYCDKPIFYVDSSPREHFIVYIVCNIIFALRPIITGSMTTFLNILSF